MAVVEAAVSRDEGQKDIVVENLFDFRFVEEWGLERERGGVVAEINEWLIVDEVNCEYRVEAKFVEVDCCVVAVSVEVVDVEVDCNCVVCFCDRVGFHDFSFVVVYINIIQTLETRVALSEHLGPALWVRA